MIAEILKTIKKNLFLIFLIVLISLLSFQLGRISNPPTGGPIKIERASIQEIFGQESSDLKVSNQNTESGSRGVKKIDFRVVVSKNGTKYHFAWCPSAKRIKPENQIWFNSEKEAISAGYSLAANCTK